jgi:hypothetical protein
MTLVNVLLDRVFEILLQPFASLPILGSLAVVSFLTAIAILLVTHRSANPQRLHETKRQMYADLLEIRLFKDDLGAMLQAQGSLFRHNAAYLRLALIPALWILVPLAFAVVQLQCYFGYSGVGIGKPVLVTAALKSPAFQEITFDPPAGTHLDSPAIWFPHLRQVVWRVVVDSAGEYILRLRVGGTTYEKTLHASDRLARRSPLRPGARLIDEVLNPSETPLADSGPLASIGVAYPDRRVEILGLQATWVDAYTLLSIIFVVALKAVLAVLRA